LIVRRHPRRSVSHMTAPHSSNSFTHNLLSDPHPLNPVVSILYKNGGGRGASQVFSVFRRSDGDVPSPLESTLEKRVTKTRLSTFRMNTSKSVSKQMTLSSFRINTYEKQGRGRPVIVNQESDQDSCPACPDLVGEEHRDEGSLFPRSTDHGPGQFRVSLFQFLYAEGYFNTPSGRITA
jgi:hypothetical protein